MTEAVHSGASTRSSASGAWWPVAIYCVAVILLFWETASSIVDIWSRSETYMHGYLIVPISVWLVWNKRTALSAMPLRPLLAPQVLLLLGGLAWLLAHLIDVLVVQQFALVGLLIVGVWSLVGNRVAWMIAFPLGFLLLAVPVGEDLVPAMMEFTATSTVALVRASGVPVYREGMYFSLPSGNWSVVYACSGVRYLLASITLGVLYAYLTYRSLLRRSLFILLSIIVPVLANSARAYIIVMLGHLSDMRVATGVDHLLYGWVFFGIVMFILFWLGSYWREDLEPEDDSAEVAAAASAPSSGAVKPVVALLTAVLAVGIWPALAVMMSSSQKPVVDAPLESPVATAGWQKVAPAWQWVPFSRNPDRAAIQFYARDDQRVSLYLFQFLQQEQGSELVAGINLFVSPDDDWRVVSRRSQTVDMGQGEVAVDRLELRLGEETLLVWSWYRIGSHYTANRYEAKLWELVEQITFSDRGSAHIVLGTDTDVRHDAEALLQAFLKAQESAIEAALDARPGDALQ